MTFGIQQHIAVSVCEDAADAVDKGFVYLAPVYSPIEIEKAVVVRNGTQSGQSTVDLVLRDEQGKLYVVMITGNLLKSIPC